MKLEFPGAVPEIPVSHIDKVAAYCEPNWVSNWIEVAKSLGLLGSQREIAGYS